MGEENGLIINEKLIGRSFLIEEKGEDFKSYPYEVRVINVTKSNKYVHFEYNDLRMMWKKYDDIQILEEVFSSSSDDVYTNVGFIDSVLWMFDNVMFTDRVEFANNVDFIFYNDPSPAMIPDMKVSMKDLEKFMNTYDISKHIDSNDLIESVKAMCVNVN